MSYHADMKEPDDLDELLWAAILCQYRPEGSLLAVSKALVRLMNMGVHIQVLLFTFLVDLSH